MSLTDTPHAADEFFQVGGNTFWGRTPVGKARMNGMLGEYQGQVEDWLERKTEASTSVSPCGSVTLDIVIEWGRRGEKWYFISLVTKRQQINELDTQETLPQNA